MNSKIYGKLAVTNLKNNKKSYIPYILASAFSVMMYFIMDNLYRNRSLVEKGSPLAIMLSYAAAVILIFSDRKSTRLNSSHKTESRMPSSA